MNKSLIATLVGAAALSAAVLAIANPWGTGAPADPPPQAGEDGAAGASPLSGDPGAAGKKAATKKAAEKVEQLLFPDGSKLPPLNGVQVPAPMEWPGERPFSPVVSRATGQQGREWYIHADGSRTSTWMEWRKDLGRYDAVTVVDTPVSGTPVPVNVKR